MAKSVFKTLEPCHLTNRDLEVLHLQLLVSQLVSILAAEHGILSQQKLQLSANCQVRKGHCGPFLWMLFVSLNQKYCN